MKFLNLFQHPGFIKFMGFFTLVVSIICLVSLGGYCMLKKTPLDPISSVVTILIFTITTIINFYFGSSSGSKDKDETLKNVLNNTPQQVIAPAPVDAPINP